MNKKKDKGLQELNSSKKDKDQTNSSKKDQNPENEQHKQRPTTKPDKPANNPMVRTDGNISENSEANE
ncbi:hypothetical protein HYE43_03665 [Mycoplasmopsis bovis]|nr:hypothetical protein [Mycoplasmopsis bovis]QQH20280.1 hypothetical protein HYE43_03665 [Mycoplasmopsis bovis]